MGRFAFDKLDGRIYVTDNGKPLFHFPAHDYTKIRPILEGLGWSSHSIGAIVRLVNEKFPLDPPEPSPDTLKSHSLGYWINYLISLGYRVVKPEDIPIDEVINYVNNKGYMVLPPPSIDNSESNTSDRKDYHNGA